MQPRRLVPSARAVASTCALLAWCLSVITIVGNAIDSTTLTSFVSDMPGLQPVTSTALILLAAALWFERDPGHVRRWLAAAVSTAAGVLGAVALFEYILDVDLGLAEIYGRADAAPSAMSPQSSVAVLLLAAAFLTIRPWPRVAQGLALGALMTSVAAMVAIGFGIGTFLGMEGVVAMSLPGALAVSALAVGVIALDTYVGVGHLLVARTRGGQLARRGLALTLLGAGAFGVAVFTAHETLGLVTSDVAAALYFLGTIVIVSGLVLPLGFTLDRVDRARATAIQDLVASESRARELIEHAPEAIVVLDVELGRFVRVNIEAERLFKLPSHELLRRGPADVSAPTQADGRPSATAIVEYIERTIGGETPVFDWLLHTPAGQPIEAEVRLLRLPDPGRTLVRGSIVEVGERKRAEAALRAVDSERAARAAAEEARDEQALLQRITARLLTAPSVDDVATVFVEQVVPDLGATSGIIFTIEGDTLVRRGYTDDAGDPGWSTLELNSPTTAAEAVRTRRSVVVGPDDDGLDRFPLLAAAIEELGHQAWCSYPIYAGKQLLGVASLGYATLPSDEHWTFLGTVADRVGQALERARLFEGERDMRRQLEYAAGRTTALQRVTEALARAITPDEVIDLTATLGIDALGASAATTGILDADGTEFAVRTFGFPKEGAPWYSQIAADAALPGPEAVRTQRSLWFRSSQELLDAYPSARRFVESSRFDATACVPLIAWGRPLGFLAAHYPDDREFTDLDRVVFTTLASVSAQALERARRFASEHETASALQQSMLPARLPELPGIQIAARYSSAGDLDVGGDWYDAIALDDGSVIVTVGDVVGRGLAAATAMGQLRSAINALSLATKHPRDLLAHLDRYATNVDGARLATVAVARLDPATHSLEYASAGHVPGVLVLPDGTTRLLEPERSLPLDALPNAERDELRVDFPTASTLVLYSDGLIERRGESLDVGLRRLTRTAASLSRVDVDAMCQHITVALLPKGQQRDDVAVLCLRLSGVASSIRRSFPATPSELAPLRRQLRSWLAGVGLSPERAADLILAVDEACANAVEHAYAPDEAGEVVVELARDGNGEVVATVQDAGRWRDQPSHADRGRGLGIIEAAVDEYDIQTGEGGTTVLLRQRVRGR